MGANRIAAEFVYTLDSQEPIRNGFVEYDEDDHVENYPVKLVLSHDGYFKKITMASLRGNDELKFKDGDMLRTDEDAENIHELLFFSDKAQGKGLFLNKIHCKHVCYGYSAFKKIFNGNCFRVA